jgi:hypothetical protein
VTVPPINELLGAQMLLVPLITALSNSPEYDTPTPPTDPAADSPPFEPRVKLVQLVQTVTAGAGVANSNKAIDGSDKNCSAVEIELTRHLPAPL